MDAILQHALPPWPLKNRLCLVVAQEKEGGCRFFLRDRKRGKKSAKTHQKIANRFC